MTLGDIPAARDQQHTRAAKHLGNFGEGLVTYNLIRKGFEVAHVDHVGADLIAERHPYRIAVSVKTRMFKSGSVESRGVVVEEDHLQKLEHFAQRFNLDPVVALAACIADERVIHLFMVRVEDIRGQFEKVKFGYTLRFSKRHFDHLTAMPCVDYSSWSNETIGCRLFA
jgi:Holliday junction resolvase